MRDVFAAAKVGRVEIEVVNLFCPKCNERRMASKCQVCGATTNPFMACPKCGTTTDEDACPNCRTKTLPYSKMSYDFRSRLESIRMRIPHNPAKPVKGVRGLTSVSKMPEPLEKGIIRSNHDTYVYKDGTLRIDATNEPLTHFRPRDTKSDIQSANPPRVLSRRRGSSASEGRPDPRAQASGHHRPRRHRRRPGENGPVRRRRTQEPLRPRALLQREQARRPPRKAGHRARPTHVGRGWGAE